MPILWQSCLNQQQTHLQLLDQYSVPCKSAMLKLRIEDLLFLQYLDISLYAYIFIFQKAFIQNSLWINMFPGIFMWYFSMWVSFLKLWNYRVNNCRWEAHFLPRELCIQSFILSISARVVLLKSASLKFPCKTSWNVFPPAAFQSLLSA